MYRNFICYRGSSSAGLQVANELFMHLNASKSAIGETYFSPIGGNNEKRNFITDPAKYLSNTENFIMILTKDFFNNFLDADGNPNPNSVTRLEIDESLKNDKIKYIPVVFPDFRWGDTTGDVVNSDIMIKLWGKEAAEKIVGAIPIPYVFQYSSSCYELVKKDITAVNNKKKVVIFDFDGTLTTSRYGYNTWEKLWMALGYPVSMCEKYHAKYSNHEITHDEWCEITEKYFKERGLGRKHLVETSKEEALLPGAEEVIKTLKAQGLMLFILSGSIRQYIELVLGHELTHCFTEIKANRFVFDEQGMLDGIIGTPYDFEGKARFVSKIINDRGIDPADIIYVGNSFNDEFVYESGVETLCINPARTDFYNNKVWHNYLRDVRDLHEILPYIYGSEHHSGEED